MNRIKGVSWSFFASEQFGDPQDGHQLRVAAEEVLERYIDELIEGGGGGFSQVGGGGLRLGSAGW